jgi:lipopolysaccharide transport system permease protein
MTDHRLSADLPTIVIQPTRGWAGLRLRELWEYRELLYFLVWRDIKVRYKQTLLGAAWAVIQPFMTMVVFSIFFGRLAGVPSDGIPYPIFAYSALVVWTFFANGLGTAADSLVASSNLLKKVYFPRLIIPISGVLNGLPDFGIAFVVLLGMMLFYGVAPIPAAVIWLPIFLLLAFVTALGAGLWLSAFNVQYRDVRYILPFLIQLLLFATPIAYPASLLPESLRALYGLNPMVGVVEGFRWALLSGTELATNAFHRLPLADSALNWAAQTAGSPPGLMTVISAGVALILLVTGALYFRRVERTFADLV